jgi:hypothetical protein
LNRLLNSNNRLIINFFKDENYYGIAPFTDYEKGVKVKFVDTSHTKDTFIVEGLFNVRLSEQIFLFYSKLR